MSKTKHTPTPGPWNVNPRHTTLVEVDDGSQTVANTGSWRSNTRDLAALAAEQEANARLCAAAPDLLAVAEEAEPLLAKLHSIDAKYASWNALVRIRTAIRKAKGENDD